MLRVVLLSVYLMLAIGHAHSQTVSFIPFEFTSEEDNRFIKEDDSFKYYVASGDTNRVVGIDEDALFYKLLNREHKVIADGSFIIEGDKYLQDGTWTERFANGKIKITGYYHKSRPAGTWEEYYSNGKLKMIYNYAIITNEYGITSTCLSGSYQEFYQDGKLKINGFYTANMTKVVDSQTVNDPIDGHDVIKLMPREELKPVKTGHWEYYAENGELYRKEDF